MRRSVMAKHENNGSCKKCLEILYKYPNPVKELVLWFMEFQRKNPSAHIACAGRGKIEQEECYHRGASKARYLQSAHNFGAALDFFVLTDGKYTLPLDWFRETFAPQLPAWLVWAGTWKTFKEYPHVELIDWRERVKRGELKAVE
jgi:hypothetical protein